MSCAYSSVRHVFPFFFISNKTFYNLENYQTTKQWNNTGKKTIGFAEYYVKPVSHVYAESVVAWYWFDGVKDKTKPLGGKTITATICTFGEDNKLKEYATATATDADVVIVSSENSFCYIEFKFAVPQQGTRQCRTVDNGMPAMYAEKETNNEDEHLVHSRKQLLLLYRQSEVERFCCNRCIG